MDHQRAGGDALSSAGRSPAIAADGPSPSEDAATEEADGAPSPRPPLRERSPGHGQQAERRDDGGRQRRRHRRKEKQESGRASLPRTEEGKAAPQGRAESEGRAGQRPRRAPGKRVRRGPGQQEGRGGRLASRPGRRRAGEDTPGSPSSRQEMSRGELVLPVAREAGHTHTTINTIDIERYLKFDDSFNLGEAL
ncbi:hypothetical protein THAOC_20353 [Thalassiosira oceanica]|uniref:Uncharacterized protein n=1 Tax=Thalassiosira oceanica TaxID=159749 RepID=K0RZZ5_THAOC|nr:hypothetical protein THAOC_20353 [Thalassiosira oceanica]|eukprot:EJK59428.1 hypothetical protein THAOC_20353 [Thalassiosira oceanica]